MPTISMARLICTFRDDRGGCGVNFCSLEINWIDAFMQISFWLVCRRLLRPFHFRPKGLPFQSIVPANERMLEIMYDAKCQNSGNFLRVYIIKFLPVRLMDNGNFSGNGLRRFIVKLMMCMRKQ